MNADHRFDSLAKGDGDAGLGYAIAAFGISGECYDLAGRAGDDILQIQVHRPVAFAARADVFALQGGGSFGQHIAAGIHSLHDHAAFEQALAFALHGHGAGDVQHSAVAGLLNADHRFDRIARFGGGKWRSGGNGRGLLAAKNAGSRQNAKDQQHNDDCAADEISGLLPGWFCFGSGGIRHSDASCMSVESGCSAWSNCLFFGKSNRLNIFDGKRRRNGLGWTRFPALLKRE